MSNASTPYDQPASERDVHILVDIQRWISERSGMRTLLFIDAARLKSVITEWADLGASSTDIWYMLTSADEFDAESINANLRELHP